MKSYPRMFCLVSCAACALVLSSCGLSEKGAQKLCETGWRDMQSNDPQTAEQAFSKAIDLDSKYAPAYEGRASARLALKDFAGAKSDCSAAIKLDSSDERAFLVRGLAEYQLEDYAGATNDFSTAISLAPEDGQACLYLGASELKVRNWDAAETNFTKAIENNPNDAMAYRGRAAANEELKNYEKALADASTSIDLDSLKAGPGYGLRAHVRTRLKDRAGALYDADQTIELQPSDSVAYVERASVKILWDDFSGASNDLEIATELNPTNAEILLCQGMLDQKTRQTAAAITDFNRALAQLGPQFFGAPDIHEALGHLDEDLSQWRPALDEFREGLAANSPPEGIYFEIYLIRCRLGENQDALKELNAYIQSIPPAKTNDWSTCIAHFLTGDVDETQFLARATTLAKRPTDISDHTCDVYYFEGMQHLLAGDKAGAAERFQKSVDTKEDNNFAYMSAVSGLQALKGP